MENETKCDPKTALVLTGATAEFNELIKEALKPEVLQKLHDEQFSALVFQAGHGLQYCLDLIQNIPLRSEYPKLKAFDFKESLQGDLKACQYRKGKSEEGLIITHAGSGTVLDVLRMGLVCIVVPNPALLDNHQQELADELDRQGYVTKANVKDLVKAIDKTCKKAKDERKAWKSGGKDMGVAPVADTVIGYDLEHERETRAVLD